MRSQGCLATLCWSLAACATPTGYQALNESGGYSETRTADNAFVVRFQGNAKTSQERADDFALMRAAELALESGYAYFEIADSAQRTAVTTFRGPAKTKTKTEVLIAGEGVGVYRKTTTTTRKKVVVTKPVAAIIIVCSTRREDDSEEIYDARVVVDSLARKYGIATPHP